MRPGITSSKKKSDSRARVNRSGKVKPGPENFVVVGGIVAQEKLFEFDQCHPYQADCEEIMGPGFALSGINRHMEGAHSEK